MKQIIKKQTATKRINILLIIFAIASVIVTVFIFGNSIQSGEASMEISGQISERVHEIVEPESADGYSEEWDVFVRKSAHAIEFAALGICVAGFVLTLFQKQRKLHICAALFYVLSVAVLDEYIQSFTGRSSSVRDTLIDFAGGCCGIAAILLAALLIKCCKYLSSRSKT